MDGMVLHLWISTGGISVPSKSILESCLKVLLQLFHCRRVPHTPLALVPTVERPLFLSIRKEMLHWNSPCSSCLKTKVMIVSYLQLNLLLMQSTLNIRRMNKLTDSGHIIQMRIWKLSTYSCILPSFYRILGPPNFFP